MSIEINGEEGMVMNNSEVCPVVLMQPLHVETHVDGELESPPAPELSLDEKVSIIEALLFASGEPQKVTRLAEVMEVTRKDAEDAIDALKDKYTENASAIEVVRVSGKVQLRTRPQFASYILTLKAERPKRLSRAALETLAIIAYRQPLVKSDIEKIRGVECTPTLKTLLDRALVKIVGYQSTVGQPALYGTTDDFLSVFGLNSLAELPLLRDIESYERDPGEAEEKQEPLLAAG